VRAEALGHSSAPDTGARVRTLSCMSEQSIGAGAVVRFSVRGARRRYVVLRVDAYGTPEVGYREALTVLALSGSQKGCYGSSVEPGEVVLDEDQAVAFTGAEAPWLMRRYQEAVAHAAAMGSPSLRAVAPPLSSAMLRGVDPVGAAACLSSLPSFEVRNDVTPGDPACPASS
jgi:hypothetical protein